jgi:hypothetical protein
MPLTAYPGILGGSGAPFMNLSRLWTDGDIWFVHSGRGSNNNDGRDPLRPRASIANALTQVRASRGDIVCVLEGHTETVTAAIAMSVAGVSIIGLGVGRARPAITGSGAIDVINITAANCLVQNLRLIGAAADVTALINIAAADCRVAQCYFQPGATPLASVTITGAGDRYHIHDCYWKSTANGPDFAIDLEGEADDGLVENCFFNFIPNGLDNAVIRSDVTAQAGFIMRNCVAIGLDATALFLDFNSSGSLNEGAIVDCAWSHRAAATIANGLDLGGISTHRVSAADGAQRGAILLPATSST